MNFRIILLLLCLLSFNAFSYKNNSNEGDKLETSVSIDQSTDGEVSALCEIKAIKPKDGIVRVLAIGNSFSDDAIEHYLNGLASAAGKKIIIGNLPVGGASLALHLENATTNAEAYTYGKINVDGLKISKANTSIATALKDEPWDYISFQQVSFNAGKYETYVESLPQLFSFVKSIVKNPETKYLLHQTWAYAGNSTHGGFANYSNNQDTMYHAIVEAVNKASQLIDIYKIVPSGTAIQNGRATVVGDYFTRDGYHLDFIIGRYTASAAWFEILFGESVVGNPYKPEALTDFEAKLAQYAAHFACLKPNEVNAMLDFQKKIQ